jgi:SAM-dependent methyltransferase
MNKERDYILGTNDEEILRLGLQHRLWRRVALLCWEKAGITAGSKVIDIGAGPGYATRDLAEIAGPGGQITAVERSAKFVEFNRQTCHVWGLSNVRIHELDLMTDEVPGSDHDFSWCRWVASFVSDPRRLVQKIAGALRPGGRAIFHEYGHYQTWRYSPRVPIQEEFVEHVRQSWREAGGKADIGPDLPPLLAEHGLMVQSVTPHVFCVRPNDYMWQWPSTFVRSGPARLQELGKIDQAFVDRLQAALGEVEKNPQSICTTPLVLELVAEKIT